MLNLTTVTGVTWRSNVAVTAVMALYGDSVRSPLEQVWRQFVPQGYDQALRNAFYNVAAIVFVGCVAAAAWSVYMIFQVSTLKYIKTISLKNDSL